MNVKKYGRAFGVHEQYTAYLKIPTVMQASKCPKRRACLRFPQRPYSTLEIHFDELL